MLCLHKKNILTSQARVIRLGIFSHILGDGLHGLGKFLVNNTSTYIVQNEKRYVGTKSDKTRVRKHFGGIERFLKKYGHPAQD
jgi:hypothetical protein